MSDSLVRMGEIEQETRLSRQLIGQWRACYGFPEPAGVIAGEKHYTREQLLQLRLIKRLLDAGVRPSSMVGEPLEKLEQMYAAICAPQSCTQRSEVVERAIALLALTDLPALAALLKAERQRSSLAEFVQSCISPLMDAVGEEWSEGRIAVFQEHLCTDLVSSLLSAEVSSVRPQEGAPRILFATPTDEAHSVGMLMARCVLAGEGAFCAGVGPHTPISELAAAAVAWRADVVGVSFSFSYPSHRVQPLVQHLRTLLNPDVELWVGGKGVGSLDQPMPGVHVFKDLVAPVARLHALWTDRSSLRPSDLRP